MEQTWTQRHISDFNSCYNVNLIVQQCLVNQEYAIQMGRFHNCQVVKCNIFPQKGQRDLVLVFVFIFTCCETG